MQTSPQVSLHLLRVLSARTDRWLLVFPFRLAASSTHRLTVDSSLTKTSISWSPVHGSSDELIQIIQSWQCCCWWRLSDTIHWNYATPVQSLMETHRGRCRHATSHHNDTVTTGSTLQLAGEGEGSCSIWKHDWCLGCGILAFYTLAGRRERTDMNGNTNTAPPSV